MFEFTEDEKRYFEEMRALTTDNAGQEVLVGLTREETELYMEYDRNHGDAPPSRLSTDKYKELHKKHEAARLATIGAENERRTDKPTNH